MRAAARARSVLAAGVQSRNFTAEIDDETRRMFRNFRRDFGY